MKSIFTPLAPTPAGHYSQAMEHNGFIFVSGLLPIHPEVEEKTIGSITEQTTQVIKNLEHILKAADSDLMHVLKVTIYLSDIALWGAVNKIYTSYFGTHKPARVVVPVPELHYGYQIELEAIATTK